MRFIMPRFVIDCERWKWNKYHRVYVSTFGHIKDQHKRDVPIRLGEDGYFVARIHGRWRYVHRLVLLTWCPLNADEGQMTVDHLDSNKRNNHLDNLEWCTFEENQQRARDNYITTRQIGLDSGDIERDPRFDDDAYQGLTRKQIVELNKRYIREEREALRALYQDGLTKVTFDELEVAFNIAVDGTVFDENSKEKFRKLFMDGYIVAFSGNSALTPITTTELKRIANGNMTYEQVIDRFLWKAMVGASFGGWSKIKLYWTDSNWLDAMIPDFDEDANG